ncbi:hypothetical protein, partial [Streptomyces mexicanus]|uniref:hypothetical protein n=1 Tax=Streptomyces mexicanus TaxID=178566 RepID=UPI0031E97795
MSRHEAWSQQDRRSRRRKQDGQGERPTRHAAATDTDGGAPTASEPMASKPMASGPVVAGPDGHRLGRRGFLG